MLASDLDILLAQSGGILREAYHGVLSHEDDTLSTESATNLVHLLGGDIVDGDNEDGAVLLEKALQLIEVAGLVCGLAPHSCLFDR